MVQKSEMCTNLTCAEIIGHIASEMRAKFVRNVKELQSWIRIMIDESTVHGRSYLIIYLRCDITCLCLDVFFDIVELSEGTDAESVHRGLRNSLRKAGLDDKFLGENLMYSNRWSNKRRLVTKLQQDFPRVLAKHCLSHWLDLAGCSSWV